MSDFESDFETETENLPAYAVRLAPIVTSAAVNEYDRLLTAWAGLATPPLRCPAAIENDMFQEFQPGPLLRVFLYRFKRRNQGWRILFTVHKETADDPRLVQVHQMRHAAQSPLTQWPVEVDE